MELDIDYNGELHLTHRTGFCARWQKAPVLSQLVVYWLEWERNWLNSSAAQLVMLCVGTSQQKHNCSCRLLSHSVRVSVAQMIRMSFCASGM